jgi:hypothetical protein
MAPARDSAGHKRESKSRRLTPASPIREKLAQGVRAVASLIT